MFYCPNCLEEIDEDDIRWACPFCDEEGPEPYLYCENCEVPYTTDRELWECTYCENEGWPKRRAWLK